MELTVIHSHSIHVCGLPKRIIRLRELRTEFQLWFQVLDRAAWSTVVSHPTGYRRILEGYLHFEWRQRHSFHFGREKCEERTRLHPVGASQGLYIGEETSQPQHGWSLYRGVDAKHFPFQSNGEQSANSVQRPCDFHHRHPEATTRHRHQTFILWYGRFHANLVHCLWLPKFLQVFPLSDSKSYRLPKHSWSFAYWTMLSSRSKDATRSQAFGYIEVLKRRCCHTKMTQNRRALRLTALVICPRWVPMPVASIKVPCMWCHTKTKALPIPGLRRRIFQKCPRQST